jgi:hypothetical protein
MTVIEKVGGRLLPALLTVGILSAGVSPRAEAGGLLRKRARVVVPTVQPVQAPPAATLGTFYPTPYIMVRGNMPAGGGYSPLGQFGDTTMSLYGPMSSLRSTSAPLLFYGRGYDGRGVVLKGTSFSTPNLPALSPVVYPTQATYFFGFRETTTPPWWKSGINWVDQN